MCHDFECIAIIPELECVSAIACKDPLELLETEHKEVRETFCNFDVAHLRVVFTFTLLRLHYRSGKSRLKRERIYTGSAAQMSMKLLAKLVTQDSTFTDCSSHLPYSSLHFVSHVSHGNDSVDEGGSVGHDSHIGGRV